MDQSNNSLDIFRLDGRVAIITGGSGLLGEQHAIALAGAGATVVLTDINLDHSNVVLGELKAKHGREGLTVESDVKSPESWNELLQKVLQKFGRVDILVNNAAFTTSSRTSNYNLPFESFPLEDWKQILDVNLTGTFLGCQVIGGEMLKKGSGAIINLGSLYGVVSPHHRMYDGTGINQPPAYSASKAAVLGLTRYLGALWADKGVRVNSITPGGIRGGQSDEFRKRFSNLNPMGRMAEKTELQGALLYLASDAASHVVGHNLVVDGGWTVW